MIPPLPSVIDFLAQADAGLLGAFVNPLGAAEILQLLRSCRVVQDALSGAGGLCCPHLRLRNDVTFAKAVAACDAQQLRSLCSAHEYTVLHSALGLQTLAERMKHFISLQSLGHLSLDLRTPTDASQARWFPELLAGLANCKALTCLDFQLAGADRLEIHHLRQALPIGLEGCVSLQSLRLEVDSTMSTADLTFVALAAALSRLAAVQSPAPGAPAILKKLSLGYLWWSEAQESALDALKVALASFNGSIRMLEVRYPTDQALGALEAVANHGVLGVAQGVEAIRVEEGWEADGEGLEHLVEVLPKCACLSLIQLVGHPLPVDIQGAVAEDFRSARVGLKPATLEWKTQCKGVPEESERSVAFSI